VMTGQFIFGALKRAWHRESTSLTTRERSARIQVGIVLL
jgi:hypothetical protein